MKSEIKLFINFDYYFVFERSEDSYRCTLFTSSNHKWTSQVVSTTIDGVIELAKSLLLCINLYGFDLVKAELRVQNFVSTLYQTEGIRVSALPGEYHEVIVAVQEDDSIILRVIELNSGDQVEEYLNVIDPTTDNFKLSTTIITRLMFLTESDYSKWIIPLSEFISGYRYKFVS